MSDSSARRARGQVVSAPRAARSASTAFKSQAEIAALIANEPTSAVFCAAPHGAAGRADRLAAQGRRGRRHEAALRRHLRGLPLRHGRGVRSGLQASRTARRIASAQFTCAVPEHLKNVTDAARRRIRAASPRPILLASVPLLALGLDRAHAVRQRRHRQHRLGPQARGRHAPSARATATCIPTARSAHRHTPEITGARQGARRASTPSSRSCRTPVRSRAASTPRCRRGSSRRATRPLHRAAARVLRAAAPFVRVLDSAPRVKDIVASNYAHLSAVGQWPHASR